MTARDKKSKLKFATLHPDYYTYRVLEITNIFDCNLFTAKIDLGFNMTAVIDCKLDNVKIHYNTPLIDNKYPVHLTVKWFENHQNLRLISHGPTAWGRWLVTIHSEEEILNDYLKELGVEKPKPAIDRHTGQPKT
jgi:hypothetical protein